MTTESTAPATSGRDTRHPAWLLSLCLASFAAGTDNFVISGVLREISAGMRVSEAVAGQLITAFSLTYALSAPLLAVWTARFPRKVVLLTGLAVFSAANVGAALAPTYEVLLVFRILTAVAGATMMPAAFATAASLAPVGSTGRYLGTVTFGQSISLVLGVPIGTALSGTFGWQSTMFFIAALGLLGMAGITAFLPRRAGAPALPLRRRLAPLGRRPVLIGLLGAVVGATGSFMTFSYIAPIGHSIAHAGPGQLSVLVSAMGLAGAAGTIAGGRAADAWGAGRTVMLALGLQATATLLLALCGWTWSGPVPLIVTGLLLAGWGLFGGAFTPPLQTRLLSLAGDAGNEVVALNSSCLFLGISLSGALGGAVLASQGPVAVLAAASAVGALSVLVLAWSGKGSRVTASQPAA
ncbi:MFS transporter [Streptomyces noursei]|uniref:MFS transporter n=1 Tax=Streptomyces noursei TaxID=1971 RepID=UPI00167B3338|nr:MFS transporter [Streptomyces noursei]MCZ1018936.1 MFS transporter [Streptomyces noursei]GGX22856.1 MFS transporter [Streptomyces noursei]